MKKREKLVSVYLAAGEAEAQFIKGLLECNGIPALLSSKAALSVHVFADGLGEVKVMVKESQAEEAKSLIKGKEDV